ncbi:uncharacterized protein LOC111390456 [Olea europaea subsp. europaea]|uniref:Uncharacterized protein LOC111390456, partial n=1 Tax=Olea europaea subsp. europaea TaxID=158383 RepID=A0A8S0RIU7_OLEEU|nr:uncharacterized protein LOC111390456 [Olea europaea subsp. europaea]
MGSHVDKVNLAVIIKNPLNDEEFLLIKQTPPPNFNDPEYDSYQDSDLWDLPFALLTSLDSPLSQHISVGAEDSSLLEKLGLLNQVDLKLALDQVLNQVGFGTAGEVKWKFLKYVEEPEFGPGIPVKTVYLVGKLGPQDGKLKDICKWMSTKGCTDMLIEVKPHNDRIGPLIFIGCLNDSMKSSKLQISSTLRCQEYPLGVKLIPMGSRTTKPFHTTNLVVFFPGTSYDGCDGDSFVTCGDALIVDPGCKSTMHKELEQIIAALPRKLIVFVTHHHHDHVDGLSIVQKCKPDAVLLAHESTMRRIQKDDWSLDHVPVLGSEEICVGGQRLRIISAPGHTDGHMSLLHVSTHSLIVGDHCVGQGSALLDITSGGNMSDYFRTTYKFMDLSPHVLIPMHGRVNMWPKHMLCGYLKNRRNRESTILKAIKGGGKTLFDIVAYTYADVDRNL